MATEEQETILVINQADRRDGYFSFGTSRECDYNKLIKRTGEHNVLETRTHKDKNGKITWWQCKVTYDCLMPSYGLRKDREKRGAKGNVKNLGHSTS